MKQVQKVKRKYTVENGPLVKIREAFQKRLNLSENEYLSDLPDEIRDEIEKEVIDLVVEGRSAFTIGDPTNDFEEQIGSCDWFQYQLVLKEPFKDTIFMKTSHVVQRRHCRPEGSAGGLAKQGTNTKKQSHLRQTR